MSPERLVDVGLNGAPLTAAEAEALRAGLAVWLHADGQIPLSRCLRLPNTPSQARQAARDGYLLSASRLFDGTPWQRASALHGAIKDFVGHRWLCWVDLQAPPPHASQIDALLWRAAHAAPSKLPGTPQALHQLIAKQKAPATY